MRKEETFYRQIDGFLLMQDKREVRSVDCLVSFRFVVILARSLVFGKCFWCFGAWKVEMEIARLTRGECVSRVDAGQYSSREEV